MSRSRYVRGNGAAPPPPEPPPEEKPEANLPAHVVKVGFLRVSIWHNRTDSGPRYNCTAVRLYKGTDNQWYTSTSFGYRDLLALGKALDLAHTWITEAYAEQAPV